MAWGLGGEEIRDQMQVELSRMRAHLYNFRKLATQLRHPEKGPRLQELATEMHKIDEQIQGTLNR